MIAPIPPKRKTVQRVTRSIAFSAEALRLADKIAKQTRRSRSEVVCLAIAQLAVAHDLKPASPVAA